MTSGCWEIVESTFNAERARAFETLFTLGSGRLHVRGSLEEHLRDEPQNRTYTRSPANVTAETFPDQKARWGTFVPGLFAPHPLLGNEMVNLPWFLDLAPRVGDEWCDMEGSRIDGYERTLDMRRALLTRSFRWTPNDGPPIAVRFERFVSLARPALCVQRMTLIADGDCTIRVRAGIDADVRTNGHDHFESVSLGPEKGALPAPGLTGVRCRVRTGGGDAIAILSRLNAPNATSIRFAGEGRRGRLETDHILVAGESLVIEKRTAVVTSRDIPFRLAESILDETSFLSWDDLLAEQGKAWAARWERSDVVVEGDEASQRALRLALFHLLRAHVPGDRRVAIDAKGYSGDAYFGRYFWDTEMFLLPFFLYTDPARAETLVGFRLSTLDGARRNAASRGDAGARFPWEADDAGDECCPGAQYADREIHVTGAVAHGQAHYAANVDPAWFEGPAAGLVVEAARFWLGRAEDPAPGGPAAGGTATGGPVPGGSPAAGPLAIRDVMGPDEYTPRSDNNAYTNRIAAFTLDLAAQVGAAGGASATERAAFADAVARLPIPTSGDGRLVLQCDGFDSLEEPRFDALWTDRSRPFAANVAEEHLHGAQCLKQADVLMMMALFPGEFSDDAVRAAWDYYLPRTTHDSSLSAPVHALVAARLGLGEKAFAFWERSAAIDGDLVRGGAADGIHIATCGGLWQAAVFGFAGVKTALQSEELSIDPRLPAHWSRLAFPFVWKGSPLYIEVLPGRCRVTNRGDAALAVTVCGREAGIAAGSVRAFDTD